MSYIDIDVKALQTKVQTAFSKTLTFVASQVQQRQALMADLTQVQNQITLKSTELASLQTKLKALENQAVLDQKQLSTLNTLRIEADASSNEVQKCQKTRVLYEGALKSIDESTSKYIQSMNSNQDYALPKSGGAYSPGGRRLRVKMPKLS
jgi:predicted  nucleic acid-binding Zn-ribbon protein